MQEGEVETVAEHAAPDKCTDNDETPPLAAVTTLKTDEAANGGKIELELGLIEEQTKSNENASGAFEATVAENGNKTDFEKLLIPTVEFVKPKDPAPIKTPSKIENYDEDIEDETKESFEGFNGTGRTLTLQMLMGANVIQPGKGVLTIEYLGQKFVGDLLADGKIKSQETETIFLTPSAWAMHCKRIINPEKKSGCGWASVKYKGKKLDAYKNTWLRKCATAQKEAEEAEEHEVLCIEGEKKSDITETVVKRAVFPHNTVSDRKVVHDGNMLIESVPFSAIGKLQPFLIKMNSSALLLADFHAHLTMHEVFGYLAGSWDMNTQTLTITKAYPCRNSRHDRGKAVEVETDIQKAMTKDETILVGWYHTHPKFQAEPTLRDIDTQLEYQISMRGSTEDEYTPCVALIISPYYEDNPSLESVVKSIWVTPPLENKQSEEYGRPMTMQYAVLPEKKLPEGVRNEMSACVNYYKQFDDEIIKFNGIYQNDVTYIEKLKHSLYTKFPLNNDEDKLLWNFICEILCCEPVDDDDDDDEEADFKPPKTFKLNENNEELVTSLFKKSEIALMTNLYEAKINEMIALKEKEAQNEFKNKLETQNKPTVAFKQEQQQNASGEQKQSELKVLSLQEQLCLPSGLNMNPVRMLSPLATPNPTAAVAATAATVPPPLLATTPTTAAVATVPLPPPPPPPPPLLTAPVIPTIDNSKNNNTAASLLPLIDTMTSSNATPMASTSTSTFTTATAATAVTPTINLLGPPTSSSPISIPSNAPSPAKFELPVRASPSPAKSDTSSHTSRTRASPSASPGKFSAGSDLTRNSPCRTPTNTHLPLPPPMPPGFGVVPSANDLMQASLAHFAGQLPPNFLQADLAALFTQQQQQLHQQQLQQQQQQQQHTNTHKDYGSSSLNQLAAAAAKAGATKSTNHMMNSNQNNTNNNNNNNNIANVMSNSGSGSGSGSNNSRHTNTATTSDANVAAAVAAYSSNFNIPRVHEKTKSERSSKSSSTSSNSSASATSSTCATTNSYRTKLMKELDDLKNDPLKMSELMRSPEYAALLLQQAEALGANSLAGSFGGDFNYLANTSALNMSPNNMTTNNQSKSTKASATTTSAAASAAAAAAANMALTADYNNLIQASKLLGYDAYLQQAKNSDSLNAFLQQQMAAINVPSASSAKKLLQQQQQQAVQQQLQQLHMQQQHQQQVAAQQAAAAQQQQQQQQQQQAAAVAAAAAAAAAAHPDYAALLQTYSKLFDTNNAYNSGHKNYPNNAMHHELTALLSAGSLAGMGGIPGMTYANNVMSKSNANSNSNTSNSKHKPYKSGSSGGHGSAKTAAQQHMQQQQQQQQHNADMLNQLLQAESQQQQQQQQQQQHANLNAALLYQQHKSAAAAAAAADLNSLFAMPSASVNKSLGNAAAAASTASQQQQQQQQQSSGLNDPAAYYNALAHEKMQDYAAFLQQQHSKYGIPDPLAKSTLAANNMFMSPSALLKMQQESLNAMMMKPPKSTTPATMHRQRETSLSPALERLTPTKNNSGSNANNASGKYNFSAVDLAISSVSSNTPSPSAASDSSNSSTTHRRPAYTPPVDLSRFYGELMPPHLSAAAAAAGMTRKRMEFSSIADLAAPPAAKMRKPNEDVLNLSNEQ